MDENQKSTAIAILDEILKRPVVSLLLRNVINENIKLIKDNSFSNLEEWISHFQEIIEENCQAFNDPSFIHYNIRGLVVDAFKKAKLKHLAKISNNYWYELILHYRTKAGKIMIHGPDQYMNLMNKINKKFTVEEDKKKNDDSIHYDDLIHFSEAVKELKEDKYHEKMIEIIEKNEPNITNLNRTYLVIDLTSLKKSTTRKLIDYVKQSLSEKGIEYPEQ